MYIKPTGFIVLEKMLFANNLKINFFHTQRNKYQQYSFGHVNLIEILIGT